MQSIAQSGGETFGAYLRRQAAWLGVPVVNSTGTGTFSSRLPMPHLSLAIYSAMRPDLWRYLSQADRVRLEAGYFNETYVADAAGRVLAQVPPETEGYALAQITLADALPQPRGQQPRFGLPDVAYHLVDFANIALTPLYRRNVRRFYGPRMAPPGRQTRLWMGVIVFASVLGYWLGKAAGRRR